MLTHDGARLQVFLELQRLYPNRRGLEELVIVDRRTIERPWGWVFFYTTRGWLDGDIRYAIGGNAPYIVNRFDGTLRLTGTAHVIEHYIREYETALDAATGTWELFITEPPMADLLVMRKLRDCLGLTIAEMAQLRKKLPCAAQSGTLPDLKPLLNRLREASVSAEIRRPAL